jgi:hypothetical protein
MIAARHSEGIRAHGTRISWCYTYRLTPQTATPGDRLTAPLRTASGLLQASEARKGIREIANS